MNGYGLLYGIPRRQDHDQHGDYIGHGGVTPADTRLKGGSPCPPQHGMRESIRTAVGVVGGYHIACRGLDKISGPPTSRCLPYIYNALE
ncbi:hypothetical protein J6590_016085 [Homalodisca vitripennis]|nr:hypothetical protein J6590_016085 [Homalodisca vitripennis]